MTKELSKYQAEVSNKDYCEWCWDLALENKKKKNPVYACCAFGMSGFYSPMTVCRNCLMAIANQEIEHFRTDAIEPIEKLSVEESVQIEVDVIRQIAFEGLE